MPRFPPAHVRGLVVLVCLVSPYRDDRDAVRGRFSVGDFVEIHVDTPLEVCQARDPKGLYRQAEQRSLPNMTGVGQGYEAPPHAQRDRRFQAISPNALRTSTSMVCAGTKTCWTPGTPAPWSLSAPWAGPPHQPQEGGVGGSGDLASAAPLSRSADSALLGGHEARRPHRLQPVPPLQRIGNRLRHHLLLGRPDDHDDHALHRAACRSSTSTSTAW